MEYEIVKPTRKPLLVNDLRLGDFFIMEGEDTRLMKQVVKSDVSKLHYMFINSLEAEEAYLQVWPLAAFDSEGRVRIFEQANKIQFQEKFSEKS